MATVAIRGILCRVVFVLSGPVLSLGSFYNEVACAAWIPWALFLTDFAMAGLSLRPWILLTVVFTLQFFAGEPFTLLATFFICLAFALYRRGGFRRPLAWTSQAVLLRFFLSGCLMVALGAVQLFPALALLRSSIRGALHLPFSQMTYWSLHPLSTVEFVVPQFFGPMFTAPSLWTPAFNFFNKPYFPSLFLGFVPVFFALLGWTLAGRLQRFVGRAGVAFLLLAFGRFTPLYRLLLWILPPLHLVRFPIKLLIPAVLLMAMLSGWGIDFAKDPERFGRKRVRRVMLFWAVAAVLLSLFGLMSWVVPQWIAGPARWILTRTIAAVGSRSVQGVSPKALAAAVRYFLSALHWQLPGLVGFFTLGGAVWLVGLQRGERWSRRALSVALFIAFGQLVVVNYSVNPTVRERFYDYVPPVLGRFRPSSMPYRFCDVFGDSAYASVSSQALAAPLDFTSIPAARGLSGPAQAAFQERLLLEHGGMLEKAEGISNVDPDWSFPVSLYQYWVYALHRDGDRAQVSCLFGRGNVRYQILGARRDFTMLREVAPVFNGSMEPSYLYENLCALPRAYVADSAIGSPDANQTLARLATPTFNARAKVLLASNRPGKNGESLEGGAGRGG